MVPTKSGQSNMDNKQATQRLLDLPLNINGNRLNPKSRRVITITGKNNQSELELLRQTQQLAAAGEIAHMAISTLNLDLLFSSSLELIREMFSYYHASIFLVDSESNMVVLRESTGEAGRQLKAGNHKLAVGSNSLIGLATASRQPVIVQDMTSDLTHFNNPLLPETRAEAVIPLLAGGVVVGALDVQSTITGSFNASNVTILTIIADQLAIAIQNIRLYEAAQKELTERKSAEQALQGIKDELEINVQARTIELSLANTQLENELAERNQVEEALRESELKYRALTEHIPAVVYVDQDRDMKTIYISPYVEQMLGYSPKEWIEKPDLCWDLIHPEDRERVAEELNRAKKTSPFALEYRYIAKNGQIVWVRDESILIKGRNGLPDIWQGILLDITERKQAEAAAREAG
ncbi:MAG TPA: PAS domain-containing protein, partial [Anaerolineales bacterium]|nr:PAS domain-containing protein [Anaerolineales bacterium]